MASPRASLSLSQRLWATGLLGSCAKLGGAFSRPAQGRADTRLLLATRRMFHMTPRSSGSARPDVQSSHGGFIDAAKHETHLPRQEQFSLALKTFMEREKYRKGHVSFIRLALKRMEEFGVERDLLTYNRLLDLFPKGRFVPRRMLDAFWPRPLPQMELALDLLTVMEEQGVRPDDVTYSLLVEIFGKMSFPVQKCCRMAYWFDRFKHSDPYRCEGDLPTESAELAKLALHRMLGREGVLTQHKLPLEGDPSFLLYGHTRTQLSRLLSVAEGNVLHVEGPQRLWLQSSLQHYYLLRLSSREEGEEGLVLGLCILRPASRDTLSHWLTALTENHPPLSNATVVYNITELDPKLSHTPLPPAQHTTLLENQC